jgi:hypothetical protein
MFLARVFKKEHMEVRLVVTRDGGPVRRLLGFSKPEKKKVEQDVAKRSDI